MKGPSSNGTEAPVAAANGEIIATKPEAKAKKVVGEEILANPLLKLQESIEKKLRNLEKRRGKLVVIKDERDKGTKLTEEQVEAVSKLGEVEQQIEYVRELQKTIQQQQRQYNRAVRQRDESEKKKRRQAEHDRITNVVRYQQVTTILSKPEVRDMFVNGTAGATKLEEKELVVLDKLSEALQPSLEAVNSTDEWNKKLEISTGTIVSLLDKSQAKVAAEFTGATAAELLDKVTGSELFQTFPIRLARDEAKPQVVEHAQPAAVVEPPKDIVNNGPAVEHNTVKEQTNGTNTPSSDRSSESPQSSPSPQVVPVVVAEPQKTSEPQQAQNVSTSSTSPPAPVDQTSEKATTNGTAVASENSKESSAEPVAVQNGHPVEEQDKENTEAKAQPKQTQERATREHRQHTAYRLRQLWTSSRWRPRPAGPRSPPVNAKQHRRPSQTNGTTADNEPKEQPQAAPVQNGSAENTPPVQTTPVQNTENGTNEQPRSPKVNGGPPHRANKFGSFRGRPSEANGGSYRPRPAHSNNENGGGFRRSFNGPRKDYDGPRKEYDGPRKEFDGPRKEYDGPRKDYNGPRKEYDGPRKEYDGPRKEYNGPRKEYESRPPRQENSGSSQRPQFRDSNDGSYRPRPARSNHEDGGPRRPYNNGPRNNDYQPREQRPKYEYGFRFAS
ncbi:keratin [Aphelenchoides avenae]|nr:keratin [Aphelenchus avenae]